MSRSCWRSINIGGDDLKVNIQKRIGSLLLTVVLVFSMAVSVVPSAAAVYDYQIGDYYRYVDAMAELLFNHYGIRYDEVREFCDNISFLKYMSVTMDEMKSMCYQFNYEFLSFLSRNGVRDAFDGFAEYYFGPEITSLGGSNVYRLIQNEINVFIVDKNGNYPYVEIGGDVPEAPSTPSDPFANKWLQWKDVDARKMVVLSVDKLAEICYTINATTSLNASLLRWGEDYWCIASAYVHSSGDMSFYCNTSGFLYVANAGNTVTDNNFEYITNDNTTTNNQVININDNIINFITENGDKITLNIDSLIWDASDHSYTANTYYYNETNNYYTYYTYNIKYEITNTYITYIGSNSAYEREEYKLYYELPDGRSSADLTADDIAGMSFQFHDVVNYVRGTTDTSLRALYHFDGNLEDSSYFSTQGKFDWKDGASITYMDSGVFKGALYLDETAHKMTFTLPAGIGPSGKDFTLQWRHYQASQIDTLTNRENYITIGGLTVLRWDERSFYWNNSTTACAPVPIGTWHELALIRSGGVLRFYINGVAVASLASTQGLTNTIELYLGDTSRAYTMLDELRVVNFAIAQGGVSYTPTSVPYDTNLVLVLPDSDFPIADEYWLFKNPAEIYGGGDFSGGYLVPGMSAAGTVVHDVGYTTVTNGSRVYETFRINFVNLTANGSRAVYATVIDATGAKTTHEFSVRRTGSSFTVSGDGATAIAGGRISVEWNRDTDEITVAVIADSGKSVNFIYFEIAAAPIADFEYVTCIYSSADIKPNTAAVQSSIPVTGYQVGGVRPTFPVRGNVWFPVSNSRIQGCYIYSGALWESVGCRYYTGSRWIPIYAFDIVTLQDCWDVSDADPNSPVITSETGFWSWWQKAWNDFRSWLSGSMGELIAAISDIPGGSPSDPSVDIDIDFTIVDGEGGSPSNIWTMARDGVGGMWELIKGLYEVVFKGMFSRLSEGIGDMIDGVDRIDSGGNVWD